MFYMPSKLTKVISILFTFIFALSYFMLSENPRDLFANGNQTYVLEGYSRDSREWSKSVTGYREREWVPFRVIINDYNGADSTFTIRQDANHGFEKAYNFALKADGRSIDKGAWQADCKQHDGYLTIDFSIRDKAALQGKDNITFSWESLFAIGSSKFSGDALQTTIIPKCGKCQYICIKKPSDDCKKTCGTGSLKVHKTIRNENGRSEVGVGFPFTLSKGDKTYEGVTDNKGEYLFSNLEPGKYTLKEGKLEGYVNVSGEGDYCVQANKTKDVCVVNKRDCIKPPKVEYGTLLVCKTIKGEGTPQAGVTFKLKKDGEYVAEDETDSEGKVRFTNLEPGTYTLEEESVEGYENYKGLGDYEVTGCKETVACVINKKVEPPCEYGSLLVKKTIDHEDGTPQDGVTFTLKKDGQIIAQGTTGSNGEYLFSGLIPGDYTLEEGKVAGYVNVKGLGTYTVDAGTDPTEAHVINTKETPDTGSLRVHKTINTENGDPQAGVKFKLRTEDGDLVAQGTTGDDGEYFFSGLEPGRYILTEGDVDGYVNVSGLGSYNVEPNEIEDAYVVNKRKPHQIPDEPSEPSEPDTPEPEPQPEPTPTPPVVEEPPLIPPAVTPPAPEPPEPPETVPDLPHTGGNTLAYLGNGILLLGLGLGVRRFKR